MLNKEQQSNKPYIQINGNNYQADLLQANFTNKQNLINVTKSPKGNDDTPKSNQLNRNYFKTQYGNSFSKSSNSKFQEKNQFSYKLGHVVQRSFKTNSTLQNSQSVQRQIKAQIQKNKNNSTMNEKLTTQKKKSNLKQQKLINELDKYSSYQYLKTDQSIETKSINTTQFQNLQSKNAFLNKFGKNLINIQNQRKLPTLNNLSCSQTSFNQNLPGNDFDYKNIGLLNTHFCQTQNLNSKQNEKTEGKKTYFDYDHQLQNNLKDMQKSFYKSEDTAYLPQDIKIKSELFINNMYLNSKKEENKSFLENKYKDLLTHISKNKQKFDQLEQQIIVTDLNAPHNIGDQIQIQEQNDFQETQKIVPMIQKAQTYIRRYKQQYEWHPQGRVGATISLVNGYLFLIGGRANNLINDVAIIKQPKQYNLEHKWNSLELYQKHRQNEDSNLFKNYRKNSEIHQNIQQQDINNSNQMELSMFNSNLKVLRSKKISFNLKKADYEQKRQSLLNQLDDFTGRYNHTACVYQNDIIIFGGEQEFDKRYNKRSVLNEVYFFNTVLLQWSKKICRGDVVEPRRNHTAVMVGSDMVVFGGLNCFEKVPNDLVYLDVIDLHWKRYGEQGKYQNIFDNKQGALCYHQSCAVYEDIQRQKLHSMKGFKASHAIIEQGIYIYGGKFDNNKLNKNVYVLNTFQYPATWKKIEPKGVAPKRRYMHTMQFDQKQKVLIIAGGITENKDILYNNDIWILKLGPQIEWMEVNCINQENLKPVANFAATMEDSQIYIFGGIHMKGFYNGELVIQEYDQTKVNQLKEGYSQEQQEETEREKLVLQNQNDFKNVKTFLPIPKKRNTILFNTFH